MSVLPLKPPRLFFFNPPLSQKKHIFSNVCFRFRELTFSSFLDKFAVLFDFPKILTMKRRFSLLLLLWFCSLLTSHAQETFYTNGVVDKREELYAFTNATIYTDYQTKIEKGVLIVRKGKIEAVGAGIVPPKGAIIIDLNGKSIYPAFIELSSEFGMPENKQDGRRGWGDLQLFPSNAGAFNQNDAVHPEVNAAFLFKYDAKNAQALREKGFAAVLTHKKDGIMRGTSAFVALADKREHEIILKEKAAAHLSFNKGTSKQTYPSSLMGSIALLRQTYLDANWYKKNPQAETNLSLKALNEINSLPQIFEANDKMNVLRADRTGDEFGIQYVIVGGGNEYQMLSEVKATNAPLILPLNFPAPYDVKDPFDANNVNLSQMKHWENAPANPKILAENGIEFALSTHGLKDLNDFWKNLRKAIAYGLSKEQALKALTFTPAKILKAENQIGSLKTGFFANFLITSGELFDEKTVIYENWVLGSRNILKEMSLDLRGTYTLNVGENNFTWKIEGTPDAPEHKLTSSDTTKKFSFEAKFNLPTVSLSFKAEDADALMRLTGIYEKGVFSGRAQDEKGNWANWSAKKTADFVAKPDTSKKKDEKFEIGKMTYPFNAFGREEKPKAKTFLIKNATVWTLESEGKLENTDVLVQNGKIAKIGKDLSATPDAVVIDAAGKHLTPGIVDEHSHIAISGGVNEMTWSSSAEVRIGDVINPEDINIYRHLSGGVTTVQQLHGSANTIGGQSAVVKMRWGMNDAEMKVQGAMPRIKFALGENVKHSNWEEYNRFPQTRMGVEQVLEDAFTRAREYERAKAANPDKVRPDLQLEIMNEILQGKRLVSCHSYVQSEINMLIKLAERYGFKISVFTHILEGYKVADKIKAHGAGASSFADWWAYKMEVQDAIPYNPALLHSAGVTTSINSDDAEMARRLNQEAAKSLKYGGMSEIEALKMATLNPAKMLRLDDRIGSIKVGKDADLVIWSDNPLSVYAVAEKTFVDGMLLFDREEDAKMRDAVQAERNRLIQKMLNAEKSGEKPQKGGGFRRPRLHVCDGDLHGLHEEYEEGE
jgi:imidazolonepropionase-like amidohydrolase